MTITESQAQGFRVAPPDPLGHALAAHMQGATITWTVDPEVWAATERRVTETLGHRHRCYGGGRQMRWHNGDARFWLVRR